MEANRSFLSLLSPKRDLCNNKVPASDYVQWSLQEFVIHITRWQKRYIQFNDLVEQIVNLGKKSDIAWTDVFYESLQQNLQNEVLRVFQDIDLVSALDKKFQGFDYNEGWRKRTTDDLQKVLLYYNYINGSLAASNCTCLHQQLLMKNPSRVRNTCISREDIFENCNMS
jgi:hypothetical protein